MKRDYVLITLNDELRGIIEIHINNKIMKAEIDNYKINTDLGVYNKKVNEAVNTSKIIREYQIENNLEVFNPICVVIR